MDNELGVFLRARRARVTPADLGLPDGDRRRTPGLRREELAAKAGVSVDYYTRLEQGRESRPSGQVVRALQAALLLNADERAHLDALVARASGTAVEPVPAPEVTPAQRRLVEAVRPAPAYLLSRVSDVLAANAEGLALLPGLAGAPARMNTIRYVFLDPAARERLGDWAASCADNVAHLRSVATTDPGAADLAELVGELTAASPEFTALWARYDVRKWTGRAKVFHHPGAGELSLTSETLTLPEGGRRLVVYQAEPGSPSAAALARLADVG
ncbi:helix-turn-helix transcriptional regulator [Phytomonospora endophytica]|uniref:Transcriptional regulator with XRE-family HTH domain n=1 Tax=Phytomonospora endophytica TaxID=714109 RepID=A0A841FQN6_9ACTN|nr:helix-turn-helix transcriptional regulator [Phytomonospora endophytica]MBB6038386.1 transcriptional regulator with XRE-family HTH domain [Phytomonospora endophytica]GIG64317.1 transcriptional regulator [Phytomonospora endophytica]